MQPAASASDSACMRLLFHQWRDESAIFNIVQGLCKVIIYVLNQSKSVMITLDLTMEPLLCNTASGRQRTFFILLWYNGISSQWSTDQNVQPFGILLQTRIFTPASNLASIGRSEPRGPA